MVLNSVVSIVVWESGRPVPARAQTEDRNEQLSEPQDQASKCLSEAIRLLKERDLLGNVGHTNVRIAQ